MEQISLDFHRKKIFLTSNCWKFSLHTYVCIYIHTEKKRKKKGCFPGLYKFFNGMYGMLHKGKGD